MDDAAIKRATIISEPEQAREEEPAALRSAAVEALRNAARQKEPREFDRLTRYGLGLIERARAIRQGRRRTGSEGDEPAFASAPLRPLREKRGPGRLRNLTGELINKLGGLRSWWRAKR
jgi:hypothetical protein